MAVEGDGVVLTVFATGAAPDDERHGAFFRD